MGDENDETNDETHDAAIDLDRRAEIEDAIARYLDIRYGAIAGDRPWTDLAEVFTDDAEFVDSVWGRHRGIDAVAQFLADSMAGLDDWDFPHRWQLIDGDRVVLGWANILPGERPDGSPWEVPGISVLEYAGGGRFSFEEDLYSESLLTAVMRESKFRPNDAMKMPPADRTW